VKFQAERLDKEYGADVFTSLEKKWRFFCFAPFFHGKDAGGVLGGKDAGEVLGLHR